MPQETEEEMAEIQRLKKQLRQEKAKVALLNKALERYALLWAKFLKGKNLYLREDGGRK